jgi:uncharacterized Zn-binding protein involved in type VI secretion
MNVLRFLAFAGATALAAGTASAAAPRPSPTPATERPTRSIAIVVNGEPLSSDDQPRVVGGRVLLPLRAVFGALGIAISREGSTILARLPSGTITLTVGSSQANVNGKPIALDSPVTEYKNSLYVPLRFLNAALGATVNYDPHAARVEIVSAYIGRNAGASQARSDGGTSVQGAVSEVDTYSAPQSITVVEAGRPRTISITSDAKIFIEDVTVHTQLRGALADVRVGDQLLVILTHDGRVSEVHDFYKSQSGTISAISPVAFVLANGRVVTPERSTEISLNGTDVHVTDLLVGDTVTVRSNPETGELRQVIASRTMPSPSGSGAPASPGASVAVSAFAISPLRPLHAGETLEVTLTGTPGGRASFDIGDYLGGIEMTEQTPGNYRGHFTIPDRFNVTRVPVYGRLIVGAASSPRLEAGATLSAATTPPAVTDVAPPPNQTVNNSRPSIYATFAAPTEIPLNVSSLALLVNGHDVTSSTTRSSTFITYSPGVDYPDGPVTVSVRVSDTAGNTTVRSWSFTIKTR